jgi:hypothetical protein
VIIALALSVFTFGIEHDGGPLEPRRDLREQLKPLAPQRRFQDAEAGSVPARAVEPRDDAADAEMIARHDQLMAQSVAMTLRQRRPRTLPPERLP